MADYSLEQYELANQMADYNFDDFVTERLLGNPMDGLRKLQNLASHLIERIEKRVPVVEEGYRVCSAKKCIPDSSTFYNHSTYSRDSAIQFLIIGIAELIYSDKYTRNVDDQLAGQMILKWSQIQNNVKIHVQNKDILLGHIILNWNINNKVSSDPNDPIARRWGF